MSKSEWASMRIDGILGWIHKLVMLVTFPLRKFWYIIGVIVFLLLVLLIVPLCFGAKFTEIGSWYKEKLMSKEVEVVKNKVVKVSEKATAVIDQASEKVSEKLGDVKEQIAEVAPDLVKNEKTKVPDEKPIRYAVWNTAKLNQVKYERINAAPENKTNEASFSELKQEAEQEQEKVSAREQKELDEKYRDVYYSGNLSDLYTARRDLGLTYLAESEKLYDTVEVVGPNSLYINNSFVFLYGIYTNPDIYDAEAARQYLQKITEGQKVHCDVVAYTTQTQAATALCFVNGIFINKAMVENNLAKNVALK